MLNCPICGASFNQSVMDADVLSEHWKQQECTLNYTQDHLDLYHYFVTDGLLLVNTLLRLPTVKHLYLK